MAAQTTPALMDGTLSNGSEPMADTQATIQPASIPRSEADRLVTGRGRFVDTISLPHMLHLAFVRSPVAHGKLVSVETTAAASMPGVSAVFTASDFEPVVAEIPQTKLAIMPGHVSPPQPPLAHQTIRFQGEPVAVVAAETAMQAQDAAAAITMELEELPPVASAEAAEQSGATSASNLEFDKGDKTQRELVRIEAELSFARQTGVTMEPRGIVVSYDPVEDRLAVWHSHQSPHLVQVLLAKALGLPEHRVLVQAPDVGGGFGVKLHLYPDEIAAAVASRLLGKPVKYIATRMEAFASDAHAREFTARAAVTMTKEGALAGMEADFANPIGAYSIYPRSSVGDSVHAATQLGAPYQLAYLSTRARTYWQNKTPSGAIRGVGQPVPCTVTEQLMDRAARHLGEDPAAFRRRHYLAADAFPLTTLGGIPMERLSLTECLDLLLEKMDYTGLRKEQARLRKKGILRGIGIATFIEQTAVGPGLYGAAGVPATSIEEARLRLEADGCVRVETGATDQGQGTLTGIRQIVAGLLGVDLLQVEVTASSSAGARGGGAWASRGLSLAGEAAALAAQTLRDNILAAAGQLLQLELSALRLEAGIIRGPGGEGITLSELAQKTWYRPHEFPEPVAELFSVSRSYVLEGRPHLMANGVQASLVEVDAETGVVTPIRHWIVEDCGHIVNPALVDGQLMGGAAQGIGGALSEACIYDRDGQLLSASFLDYAVPRADNVPPFEIFHVSTPQTGTELGIKGVGEAGTVGAPAALWGAVNDAIAHLGAQVNCQPLTSAAIYRALASAAKPLD